MPSEAFRQRGVRSWAAMHKRPAVQKEAADPKLYIEAFAKFATAGVK